MFVLFNSVITLLVIYYKKISSKVKINIYTDFNIYNKSEKSSFHIFPLPALFSGH